MRLPEPCWARLASKYEMLRELRRARAEGADVAPREVLRALSSEFPGALRELEQLPLWVIERRATELESVCRGETPVTLWMEVVVMWHSEWRDALGRKRRSKGCSTQAEQPTLRVQVLESVAVAAGLSVGQVKEILFPAGDLPEAALYVLEPPPDPPLPPLEVGVLAAGVLAAAGEVAPDELPDEVEPEDEAPEDDPLDSLFDPGFADE